MVDAMGTSIPALLQVVCSNDDGHADEVAQLAAALGVSPRVARACCRRLRMLMLGLGASNDDALGSPRWIDTARLGVRLLTVEGGASVADAATRLLALFDSDVSLPVARVSDPVLRALVARAVTERRVLAITYRSHDGRTQEPREVEPLSLTHVDGHWTLLAFCRARMDLRSFRFDRVVDATVTERHFDARQGLSLERFLHRQKNRAHRVAPTGHALPR